MNGSQSPGSSRPGTSGANVSQGQASAPEQVRIKNLDTGKYMTLEEFEKANAEKAKKATKPTGLPVSPAPKEAKEDAFKQKLRKGLGNLWDGAKEKVQALQDKLKDKEPGGRPPRHRGSLDGAFSTADGQSYDHAASDWSATCQATDHEALLAGLNKSNFGVQPSRGSESSSVSFASTSAPSNMSMLSPGASLAQLGPLAQGAAAVKLRSSPDKQDDGKDQGQRTSIWGDKALGSRAPATAAAAAAKGWAAKEAGMQPNDQAGPSAPSVGGAPAAPEISLLGKTSRVYSNKKTNKQLAQVRLVQRFQVHDGVVWAMAFNADGSLLATGGQDSMVRLWTVHTTKAAAARISASVDPDAPTTAQPAAVGSSSGAANASVPLPPPLLGEKPVRVFRGHSEDVLDLSWSQGNFLLSASVDKTVRLWHAKEPGCLREFAHADFVPSVTFHPTRSKLFASGCLDGRVRLWDVSEGKVVASAGTHQDMVTAVSFSRDHLVAGTMRGTCRFYRYMDSSTGKVTTVPANAMRAHGAANKLEYIAQIDVKDSGAGSDEQGHKITGISTISGRPGELLVTSSDSRLRRYYGYAQQCKYKGQRNKGTLVRAHVSQSGQHVVCGSEDGRVYLWDTFLPSEGSRRATVPDHGADDTSRRARGTDMSGAGDDLAPKPKAKNDAYESFVTDESAVTVALLAPKSAWRQDAYVTPQQELPGGADLDGALFVVAGFSGRVQVFENLAQAVSI